MNEREALRLALEALERSVATCFDQYAHQQVMSQPDHFINQTITAIKEVLEQPEQEPVARVVNKSVVFRPCDLAGLPPNAPLYTTPPQRKPLTDEQREEIAKGWRGRNWTLGDIIDAVEVAHGIKE